MSLARYLLMSCGSRTARAGFAAALFVSALAPRASAQAVVPRPLGAGLVASQPPSDAAAPPLGGTANPAGRLTLRDALGLALRQSPDLAAFAWEVRARESAAGDSGRRRYPVVHLADAVGAARVVPRVHPAGAAAGNLRRAFALMATRLRRLVSGLGTERLAQKSGVWDGRQQQDDRERGGNGHGGSLLE